MISMIIVFSTIIHTVINMNQYCCCSYYNKYGPMEGVRDRKGVQAFLRQSIVMCSSCR